jgi:hypothetical protein
VGGAIGEREAPGMRRGQVLGMSIIKRRGRGGGMGAEDGETSPGRVSIYAVESGAVAAQWRGRTPADVDTGLWCFSPSLLV